MLKLLSFLGNIIYFLSYPFFWVIGTPLFTILTIGKNPLFSWPLALLLWYFYHAGFRDAIPIPYTNILIETGEENAILYLIIALVALPFFVRRIYDSLFYRGLWAFIKDPLNLRKNKKSKTRKAPPQMQPVQIIVPTIQPDSISHAVYRLAPHLQRLLSGVDRAESSQNQTTN